MPCSSIPVCLPIRNVVGPPCGPNRTFSCSICRTQRLDCLSFLLPLRLLLVPVPLLLYLPRRLLHFLLLPPLRLHCRLFLFTLPPAVPSPSSPHLASAVAAFPPLPPPPPACMAVAVLPPFPPPSFSFSFSAFVHARVS